MPTTWKCKKCGKEISLEMYNPNEICDDCYPIRDYPDCTCGHKGCPKCPCYPPAEAGGGLYAGKPAEEIKIDGKNITGWNEKECLNCALNRQVGGGLCSLHTQPAEEKPESEQMIDRFKYEKIQAIKKALYEEFDHDYIDEERTNIGFPMMDRFGDRLVELIYGLLATQKSRLIKELREWVESFSKEFKNFEGKSEEMIKVKDFLAKLNELEK